MNSPRVLQEWPLPLTLLTALTFAPGCGSGDGGPEVVEAVKDAPVHNPTESKSPMAKINPDNEAENIDKIPGAVTRP